MPPTEIGKYRVLRELGRGAMGAVYLGEDPFIGRRVAIKVMRPQVEEGAERFLQEARTVGSLSHPNIVLLHDFGFAGELPYLVMEHVDGTILDKWLAEPRDARERLRVLAGLCRAVAYAHSRGVLHRDLKPSNVLVRSDGEAKLLDFGIALVENTRMTATGVVLGTPEYLAPELLGSGRFSPRSDMYALGLVAYELFGGRNPFAADTVAACLRRVLEVEPVPLAADSSAPAEVAAEVMRCLAKDPLRRPESPEHLLAATERALAAGLAPAPAGRMASAPTTRMESGASRRSPARWMRPLGWVAAAAVVAVGLATAYRFFAPTGSPAKEEAAQSRPSVEGESPAVPPEPAAAAAQAPASASAAAPSELQPATPAAKPRIAPLTPADRRPAGPAGPAGPATEPSPGTVARAEIAAGEPAAEPAPPPASTVAEAPPPQTASPSAAAAATPAPQADSVPALAPPAPALPRLTSLAPSTLRRGAGVTVRLRGETIPDGWNVQLRRGGKVTNQVRVLRSKRTGPGGLEISLLPDDDAPIGTYTPVLVDAAGASTNALSFEVDL